jgi:hypothetical protein
MWDGDTRSSYALYELEDNHFYATLNSYGCSCMFYKIHMSMPQTSSSADGMYGVEDANIPMAGCDGLCRVVMSSTFLAAVHYTQIEP